MSEAEHITLWNRHDTCHTLVEFVGKSALHRTFKLEHILSWKDYSIGDVELSGPEAYLTDYFSGQNLSIVRMYNEHAEFYVYFNSSDEMVGFRNYVVAPDGRAYKPWDRELAKYGFGSIVDKFNVRF